MKSIKSRLLRHPLCRIVWLLFLLPVTVIAETDWSEELMAIQQLKAEGNVVQAIIDLEALHSQNPTASRLKLELGVLYLQLSQPETAEQYLSDVLADPELPVQVRINTQLLLLQAQEAQAVSDHEFNGYLEISAGQTDQPGSGYGQVGGQGQLLFPKTVFYSTRQRYTLRPLAQVTALARHYPDRPDSPWLGRVEGGLSVRSVRFLVNLTLGLQHDDDLEGWLGRAAYAHSLGYFRLRLAHDRFWHDQGLESDSLASLSTSLGSRNRASVFWEREYRSDDNGSSSDQDVGIGMNSDLNQWETEINLVQSLTNDQLALENRLIWQAAPDWRLRLRLDLTDLTATDAVHYAASLSLRWSPSGP